MTFTVEQFEDMVRRKAVAHAERIERALVHAIETGVRYVEVPRLAGGVEVYDTHELDRDATGVP